MSGKVIEFTKTQKYRFDFGTDDKLYVIIFHGKIPQAELRGLISSLKNCLYEKMPDAILLYLKQHHLEYSNISCIEIPLEKDDVMGWASYLLNSDTYEKVDENLENTDFYYAVIDCQDNTSIQNKGCYFAVQRMAYGHEQFEYHAIAQIFSSDGHGCEEHGCFSIRESDDNGYLKNIDKSEGEPVLPAFGCVDMLVLLEDIENIKSKEDAMRIAIK